MTISKNDAKKFPSFFNHKSARLWLKEKYGDFLVMADVVYRADGKVYIYHFVKDKDRYLEWKDKKARNEEVDSRNYRDTYQYIEILDSGRLRIYFDEEKREEASEGRLFFNI